MYERSWMKCDFWKCKIIEIHDVLPYVLDVIRTSRICKIRHRKRNGIVFRIVIDTHPKLIWNCFKRHIWNATFTNVSNTWKYMPWNCNKLFRTSIKKSLAGFLKTLEYLRGYNLMYLIHNMALQSKYKDHDMKNIPNSS